MTPTAEVSPLTGTDVPPDARLHRQEFREYVLAKAKPWHRQYLGRLYRLWDEWNDLYFSGRMVPTYILFTPPQSPRASGDCSSTSCFGGVSQIRLRPSLLEGKCRYLRSGPQYAEGRFLYVADVLLHEMVH
jgi:hypothetical protein